LCRTKNIACQKAAACTKEYNPYTGATHARSSVESDRIETAVLTHAHVDHSSYLPALVKYVFCCNICDIRAAHERCKTLRPDGDQSHRDFLSLLQRAPADPPNAKALMNAQCIRAKSKNSSNSMPFVMPASLSPLAAWRVENL